jgi:2-dehydropantoate 2-reductase
MRFLIAGAGAIGAYIGARMAQAGFDVTLFARGPHLRAMQERGVQVKSAREISWRGPNRQFPAKKWGLWTLSFLA